MNTEKKAWMNRLCDPETGDPVYKEEDTIRGSKDKVFPITMGIPDFLSVEADNIDRYTAANISWYEKESVKRYEYMWSQYIDDYSYKRIRRILEDYAQVKFKKETVYLDLGCGFGYFCLNLLRADEITEYHAADVHFNGLRNIIIRTNFQKKYIQVIRCSVYNLPYKTESFDLITANGVLHHLADSHSAATQIANKLSKGGYGVFIEPTQAWKWAYQNNPFSKHSWYQWLNRRNNKSFDKAIPGSGKGVHNEPEEMSIHSWVSALKTAGLEVRIKQFHFLAGFYRCWIVSRLLKNSKYWPIASILYRGLKMAEFLDHRLFRNTHRGFYYLIIVYKPEN